MQLLLPNANGSDDSSKIIKAAADRVSVAAVKAAIASNANASEDGAKNISAHELPRRFQNQRHRRWRYICLCPPLNAPPTKEPTMNASMHNAPTTNAPPTYDCIHMETYTTINQSYILNDGIPLPSIMLLLVKVAKPLLKLPHMSTMPRQSTNLHLINNT